MTEPATPDRPHVTAIMSQLKDFQRATVNHVHDRFFDATNPTDRFLVADEVGLGKTMVARGVTARLIDGLWETVDRIDVVYICSNGAIAEQNIRKLQVTADGAFTKPTRLTLLPHTINDLRQNKLNFISLTPGTSFSQHSATGKGEERALLYLMLREEWEFGSRLQPFNVLCDGMGRRGFRDLVRNLNASGRVDPELHQRFLEAVAKTDLRQMYEHTALYFQRYPRKETPPEGRKLRRDLISRLRTTLARSCVDALEPDLIILDEFQRFKHLFESDEQNRPTSEAAELAHSLFNYRDRDTGAHARTLMLSATPYTAYGFDPTDPGVTHQQEFRATIGFLLNDAEELEALDRLLTDQRRLLVNGAGDDGEVGASRSDEIRDLLLTVMCRTERLGATTDRDGMLRQVDHLDQTLTVEDLLAYTSFQGLARHLHVPDLIEYWKSAPYLLNLMERYQLIAALERARAEGLEPRFERSLSDGQHGMLERQTVDDFKPIEPGNPRVRELRDQICESGVSQLLWLNPSLPYTRPAGPFAHPGAERFTKRLIFSNWAVVPKAISAILSYAVEQQLTAESDRGSTAYSDQSRTPGAIKTLFDGERVQPGFGLVYPSLELARLSDPLVMTAGESERPDAQTLIDRIAGRLDPELKALAGSFAKGSKSDDHTWYWVAPILLDARKDPEGTRSLLGSREFRTLHGRQDDEDGDSSTQWERCIDTGIQVLDAEFELGKQPDDLPEVIARIGIGGLSVTAIRALGRISSKTEANARPKLIAATKIGLALRGLFNLPHATHLMHSLETSGAGREDTLWRRILEYAIDGNLQSVLDEYAHLLPEHLGFVGDPNSTERIGVIAEHIADAIGMKTTRTSADFYNPGSPREPGDTKPDDRRNLRLRFAVPFGTGTGYEKESEAQRVEKVRAAFNSPFWPFILTSTSVGQEGLDFHLYCHAVVHWNLPYNPVDLEQREGRVHRYKNHAVRKNLAAAYADRVRTGNIDRHSDPWAVLFRLAEDERPEGQTALWPFWIFQPTKSGERATDGNEPCEDRVARIERHVMAMPLSRDQTRLTRLLKSLVLYRSVMGQPRQEDLVNFLENRLSDDELATFSNRTRINLAPPARGESHW